MRVELTKERLTPLQTVLKTARATGRVSLPLQKYTQMPISSSWGDYLRADSSRPP